jgi:RNA polymerase sigma factor (sigma-70 family)
VVDVELLFRQHDQYLRKVLRRRFDASVPTAVIEDACASAWAIAWAQREKVHDENPVGWLVTVARREVIAELRRSRPETSSEDALPIAVRADDVEAALEARQCLALLTGLRPNQRLALSLQAAGFDYHEIAELTGKTYTWTNRHLTEGRARLRELAA